MNVRGGGGREILAIEIPWLLRAFGDIRTIEARTRTMSSLDLPYPDTYWLHIEHKSGAIGQMIVDLVARVPVRHFEVFSEHFQVEWRGKPEELYVAATDYTKMVKIDLKSEINRQMGYRDFIVEDAYLEEIRAFFEVVTNKAEPIYTIEDDYKTIQVIDSISGYEF